MAEDHKVEAPPLEDPVVGDPTDETPVGSDINPLTGEAAEHPKRQRGRRVALPSQNNEKERPNYESLSPEKQAELRQKAPIYARLLKSAEMAGSEWPPRTEQLAAAAELKCHENTIRYEFRKILERLKPGVRLIDALIPDKRGPEKGRYITDDQYDIILGTVLKNIWIIVDDEGNRYIKKKRFSYKWLKDVLNKPEFKNKVSRTQIVRQIQDIKLDDPVMVELAQKGAKYVDAHYIDKIQIDFERPWECLQSDARALPFFVFVDGELCICVLIVIMDAFSRYVLDWRLVAKRGKDAEGDWKDVDFTGKDIREMFGNVMVDYGRRPWFIYTDNGSQFRAMEPYLPLLLNYGDKGLHLVNTEPYRPQGRGIIERTLGITDTYLCEFDGHFEKDTLACRTAAQKKAKHSFEWLRDRLAYYFKNWNELDRS
jgi:hypothetical protein